MVITAGFDPDDIGSIPFTAVRLCVAQHITDKNSRSDKLHKHTTLADFVGKCNALVSHSKCGKFWGVLAIHYWLFSSDFRQVEKPSIRQKSTGCGRRLFYQRFV